jgi:tetratricopeptide (TPR) repeat protein
LALVLPAWCAGAAAPAPTAADAALAVRLCELAQQMLQTQKEPPIQQWRQAAALLDAAVRCDGKEVRYAKLLADAMIHLQDRPGAIAALAKVRELRPADRPAQLETIRLYVDQMQTLDRRLDYLKQIVGKDAVPSDIRSVVAMLCRALYLQKGLEGEAREMLDTAVKLNPLNLNALATQYQTTAPTATPAGRIHMLLGMLRANPAQTQVLINLATELASAGMVKESIDWYQQAARVAARWGTALPPTEQLDFAAELLIAGQAEASAQVLEPLLAADPSNYEALLLRALINQRTNRADDAEAARTQARNVLLNNLAVARSAVGIAGATTRPVNEGKLLLPEDLGGDAEKVTKAPRERRAQYVEALGDLAWFEVYFNKDAVEARKLLNLFTALTGNDDEAARLFVRRVDGWICLRQDGKITEARQSLLAAAERDPRAALGLIRTYGATAGEQAKAKEAAARLLSQYPSGTLGAIFSDNLRDLDVRPDSGANGMVILAELKIFPADWMKIVENPQMFYNLRVEPLKVVHVQNEAIYARLTLRNTSNYDLTIGQDGIVPAEVWIDGKVELFDPKTQNLVTRRLINVLCERVDEQLVLKPRAAITQVFRVDQGLLYRMLQDPQALIPPVSFNMVARTNPLPLDGGMVGLPGCYAVPFSKPIERQALRIVDPNLFKALFTSAPAEPAAERMRRYSLLGMLGELLPQDAQFADLGRKCLEALDKGASDAEPSTRAWARREYAQHAGDALRPKTLQGMLDDSAWQVRLLALVEMPSLPTDRQKQMIEELLKAEPDGDVRDYASASLDLLAHPPATQPSGQ